MELVIEHGANQGERFPISQQRFTIGRGRQCDVTLPDTRVSQRHTEIRWQDGAWIVYDLNSANGTWINRRRLNGPYQLRPGDQLGVGRTIISFSRLAPQMDAYVDHDEGAGAPVAAPRAPAVAAGVSPDEFGGTIALALDGFAALGALLLIVSAFLDWFSFTFLFSPYDIQGIDAVIGMAALIGGLLAFLLTSGALLMRFLLRRGERSIQQLAPYVRWIPWANVVIGGVMVALAIAEVIHYNEGSQTEVLFGFTVEDFVTLSPEPGVFIAGIGLLLLMIGAVGQIVVTSLSPRR